jgi:hypothetical protein
MTANAASPKHMQGRLICVAILCFSARLAALMQAVTPIMVRVRLWAPNERPKAAILFQRRSQDYALVVFCALINPDFYYLYLLV